MSTKVTLLQDDITRLRVDAIVNATNPNLLGGGGVDGAIHRAGGPDLLAACKKLAGCKTGEAKITPGFLLPSQYVIHTVGPVWQGGLSNERQELALCYRNALHVASQYPIRSIAFPAISCGAYGFPSEEACSIAVNTVIEELGHYVHLRKVIFCAFDDISHQNLLNALGRTQVH
ncbi:MAG: O-acetyl-ADP-ribose deacetylase (regulator of RNase III) [Paraglaciecola sp.]|jgi:O-acetyl-ADP-ribose deacetylase (regulator of RNase III)